mgnify:CR=1 FL=1
MDERAFGSAYGRAGARWMVDPQAIRQGAREADPGRAHYAVLITVLDRGQGERVVAVDAGFSRMTGYTADAIRGRPRAAIDGPETDTDRLERARASLAAGEAAVGASVHYRRDGSTFGAAWAAEPLIVEPGGTRYAAWILYEIASAAAHAVDPDTAPARPAWLVTVARTDGATDERILEISPGFAELSGYARSELLGHSPKMLQDRPRAEPERQRLRRALIAGYPCHAELLNYTRGGRPFWNALDLLPFGDVAGQPRYWLGIAADVTARKERELHLYETTYYDGLTGLPNRALAQMRMEQAIRTAHRNRGRVGFLYIDLDALQAPDSRFGGAEENALLRQLAIRLADATRASDTLAYIGADEFLVIAEDLDTLEAAGQIAERLCAIAAAPVQRPDGARDLGAHIGVSVFPDHGGDSEQLIQRADAALIDARRSACGWAVYSPERAAARIDADFIERELDPAIHGDQLAVAVQRLVALADGAVRGHEAFARWHHSVEGWIPPARFLAAAAAAGRADAIGAHVQSLAFAATSVWRAVEPDYPPRIAVNLGPEELSQGGLAERLLARLAAAELDASALEVDLPLSCVATAGEAALADLGRLRAAGVSVALDRCSDPEAAASGLALLAVDRLKLDLSVVRDCHEDPNRQQRLTRLLELATQLGLATTAVGVETADEAAYLWAAGCDEAQGYYFGRPEVI